MKTLMKSLLLLLLLSFLCFSCGKDEECQDADFIEFGQYYGYCAGERCIEIYKLDASQLYEDTSDIYPSATLNDNKKFILLPSQKFDLAKGLINSFPLGLLSETKVTFGIPDAYDQGGLYLRYKSEQTDRLWLFDNDLTQVPEYTHNYLDEVKRIKELLQ